MSHSEHHDTAQEPQDQVEAIVPVIPVALPVAGGLLMFLLALIAVVVA